MNHAVSFLFAIFAFWGLACLLGYSPFCMASLIGDGVAVIVAGMAAYLFEVDR